MTHLPCSDAECNICRGAIEVIVSRHDDVANGNVWPPDLPEDPTTARYVEWLEQRVADLAGQLERAEGLLARRDRMLKALTLDDAADELEAERYRR